MPSRFSLWVVQNWISMLGPGLSPLRSSFPESFLRTFHICPDHWTIRVSIEYNRPESSGQPVGLEKRGGKGHKNKNTVIYLVQIQGSKLFFPTDPRATSWGRALCTDRGNGSRVRPSAWPFRVTTLLLSFSRCLWMSSHTTLGQSSWFRPLESTQTSTCR